MHYRLTYPEKRIVTPEWIADQWRDRVADGEIEHNGEIVMTDQMVRDLEDIGIISVAEVLP